MVPQLQSVFDQLEKQKHNLLSKLAKESNERLNAHPEGQWSANHVIAHLITAERMSLRYVEKKILAVNEVGNTGLMEEVKMLILKATQRAPFLKFKVPKIVAEQTRTSESFEDLNKQWAQLRMDWAKFLDKIPEDQIRKKVYRHVVAGRLNLIHALLFMREHTIHHMPQINRLLRR